MPNFDGTGPNGFGPMTGRRMGACGRGGFARSGRRGAFGWFGARRFFSDSDEASSLEEEKKYLEEDLKNIKKRLDEINNK